MSPALNKPIIHGRDHGYGGADPTPPGRWIYVGDYPTDPDTTSDSPPFENSWANVGGGEQRLRFRLTNEVTLEVEGQVEGGDNGTTVTTLDTIYRPAETAFAVGAGASTSSGDIGDVVVIWRLDTTGELVMIGGGVAGPSLPDPSLESDGRVLQTFGGSAIWSATVDGDVTTLEIRRDTAANWTSGNPTLEAGEAGYETDTGKLKIGDGTTAWNSLAYFTPGGAPTGAAGGDLTGTYPNPTLTTSGVSAGSYGDSTHVPVFTVDAKGRVTLASVVAIAGAPPTGSAGGALDGTYPNPGLAATVAGSGLAETSDVLSVNVDGTTIEISSDTLQLKDTAVTPGTYGDATDVAQITVNAKGQITAASNVAVTGGGGSTTVLNYLTAR